jgi:hypothetical protein
MSNNPDNNLILPSNIYISSNIIPSSKIIPPAKIIQMDPLNRQVLEVILTQGTTAAVKHMFAHETTGQTLTYLEMRERYG